jgi:hypothetical protein
MEIIQYMIAVDPLLSCQPSMIYDTLGVETLEIFLVTRHISLHCYVYRYSCHTTTMLAYC